VKPKYSKHNFVAMKKAYPTGIPNIAIIYGLFQNALSVHLNCAFN
jgi:hypothetical protein